MGLKTKSQEKIYRNYWEYIEKNARDESKNSSKVSDYIRDYLTLKNKKIPNKNKVYQEFKLKYPISTTVEDVENNLKPIKKFAKYYHKLVNPIHEPDREIRLQLEYINRLEINVTYPFMLKVYDDYSSRLISKQTFVDVLELIQSFTWRRFIVGLAPNSLNKIFMRLYEDVNPGDYLTSIQSALINKKGNQRFPRNHEVINALREKDMYGIKAKNRIYCLERLENYQNKEPVKIEENNDITIEHIFPQNPDPQWEAELGTEEFNSIKDNYLNIIANLTLSGNNGKLGNKTFTSKRDMNIDGKEQGYKYSRLWLNRYLSEIDKWGKEEIEERLKIIAERFLQVWSFPEIKTKTEIDFNEVSIFDAEEPTGKKLEYAIFFDNKIEISEVSKLYLEVMKQLFEIQPQTFFTSDLKEKLNITKDSSQCRQAAPINETYFIEAHLDSKKKFERIKKALTVFDCEEELIIKYKI
ncbi:HNH endonuclease family protein [Okeania sp. SIO1H4]|uniref:HNH endonuclease family protein n=2 Tax=Okeania TaxID=1458928 RepID=UPI00338F2C6E